MFTVGKVNEHKVLSLKMQGSLTSEEYSQAIVKCEALLKQHGHLRFYVDMVGFTGSDIHSLNEGMKFDIKHRKQYDRVAIVGDKKWEEWAVKFSSLFFSAPMQFFYAKDSEKAWNWVNEAS